MSGELAQFFKDEMQRFGGFRTLGASWYRMRLHLVGANAAIAANYNTFDVAPVAMSLRRVLVHYTVVGGAAATLQLERIQGTETNGTGDPLFTTPLPLTAAANNVYTGQLVATSVLDFNAGDRLGAIDAGTLTGLSDLNVIALFQSSSAII